MFYITGRIIIITIALIFVVFYIIYDSIPSIYEKLDEKFQEYEHRNLPKFVYERSPLHTIDIIVYDATAAGKTCFVKIL